MPLLGKHKNADTAAREARYNPQYDTNVASTQQQTAQSLQTGKPSTTHAETKLTMLRIAQGTDTGYPQDQPISGNGAGIGAGTNAVGTDTGTVTGVPPASHVTTSADASRSGGGGCRLKGKAERAVGSLVRSQALKERGLQKEQEAGAFKVQSTEIAEAERLEKEALMRRERAVAHGAHPDNRHLGGMQNANTLSDVIGNQLVSGGQAGI